MQLTATAPQSYTSRMNRSGSSIANVILMLFGICVLLLAMIGAFEGFTIWAVIFGSLAVIVAAIGGVADAIASKGNKRPEDDADYREWAAKRAKLQMGRVEDPVEKWAREHPDEAGKQ